MKVLLLTNEYPPYVYGGAGIHVDYLSRELSKLCTVDVKCFGDQLLHLNDHLSITGFNIAEFPPSTPKSLRSVFSAIQRCLNFNSSNIDADVVHVHTWYTHLGGILAKLNYGIPLIVTTHSLEPLRPWKREQLGNGYDFSCWVEQTAIQMADAIVAVSEDAKKDILSCYPVDPAKIHIIHNGIDLNEFRHTEAPDVLRSRGIDPARPYVLFVGRITRQKGIIHLVNAIRHMDNSYQVVLCAGAPDTPEIAAEMQSHVAAVQQVHPGVIWIHEMLDTPSKIALYSQASVFCCPSIYEPFGIINLEAMACETPIVASAVGGIKEVVVDSETGLLVHFHPQGHGCYEPADPESFEKDLATKINYLMKEPEIRSKMGRAGRQRVVDHFGWPSIAKRTHQLYQSLVKS